jgi:hypothetical protein
MMPELEWKQSATRIWTHVLARRHAARSRWRQAWPAAPVAQSSRPNPGPATGGHQSDFAQARDLARNDASLTGQARQDNEAQIDRLLAGLDNATLAVPRRCPWRSAVRLSQASALLAAACRCRGPSIAAAGTPSTPAIARPPTATAIARR